MSKSESQSLLNSKYKDKEDTISLSNLDGKLEIYEELEEGATLNIFTDDLNKQLPKYILFKPETITYYEKKRKTKKYKYNNKNWCVLSDLVKGSENDMESRMLFFRNEYDFIKMKKDLIDKYLKNNTILDKKKINENTHITLYTSEVINYIIYKKLRVKFDFYYVPIHMYNSIKAKIDLMKTIQIIELLGPKSINISKKNESKSNNKLEANITSGFLDLGGSSFSSFNNKKSLNHDTSYSIKSKFYFDIDELIDYIKNVKHIFMSKDDYEKDFDLRYLIRSRIKSFLKSYSRTLNIKKLSSLENKLQANLSNIYNKLGLNFKYNNEKTEETEFFISCEFYKVSEIALIDDLPKTYDGFRILLEKYTEEKIINGVTEQVIDYKKAEKDIQKFTNNIFIEQNLKYSHEKELINNSDYKESYSKIDNFNDIKGLIKILRNNVKNTLLNERGFQNIKHKDTYFEDIKIFIRRLLKENKIDDQEDAFYKNFPEEKDKKELFSNFEKFSQIQKKIEILLKSPETTSLNNKGFDILKQYNFFNKDLNLKYRENMETFLKRYILKHNLNNKFIEIIPKIDEEDLNKLFSSYEYLRNIKLYPEIYDIIYDKVKDKEEKERIEKEEKERIEKEERERLEKEKKEKEEREERRLFKKKSISKDELSKDEIPKDELPKDEDLNNIETRV